MAPLELDIAVSLRAYELELGLSAGRETIALVGPSGAGKTTVLRAVAGLRRPRPGRIACDGETLVRLRRGRRPPARGALRRPRVPGVRALPAHERAGEHRVRRAAAGRRPARALPHLPPRRRAAAARSRAASASGSRSRARSRASPPCCCSTSRSPRSTRTRASRCAPSCRTCSPSSRCPRCSSPTTSATRRALADRIGVILDGRLRQLGTPQELIARPADAFVATFTGGNLLTGDARPLPDGGSEITLADGAVVRSDETAEGRVGVALYPWEVGVALAPPGDGLNAIPGSVHGLAPEGGRIRLRVGALTAECSPEEAAAARARRRRRARARRSRPPTRGSCARARARRSSSPGRRARPRGG